MNNELDVKIGDTVISLWIKRIISDKTESVKDFDIQCFLNHFTISIQANYNQINGKLQYDFELVSVGSNPGYIDMLAFSIKPIGILSSMVKPMLNPFFKSFEPAVVLNKNLLTVSIPALVDSFKPGIKSVLSEFELQEFSVVAGSFACLFRSKSALPGKSVSFS
jgi:hypothetical protein